MARLQLAEIRQAVFDCQPVNNGWFEAALDRLNLAIKKATANRRAKGKAEGQHENEAKEGNQ